MSNLLNVRELSAFLHVHPKTIYKWASEGRLPHRKINGSIRFEKDEIEAFQQKYPTIKISQPELIPKLDTYDKMLLKGGSAVSKKKQRWNYGEFGIFIRKTQKGSEGWYSWHYKNIEGKRTRIREVIQGAITREQAILVARERAFKAFEAEHVIKENKKNAGFNEYSKTYLEGHIMDFRRNWKSDMYRLDAAISFFGKTELRKITRPLLMEFRNSRLKAGNSGSTVNRYMALLRKMFNLAIEDGYMDHNPVKGVKFYSEADTIRDRVLLESEEMRLFEECSEHLRPIILMALHSGMRQGELLNLKWSNVDLTRRLIKVEKTKSKKARFVPINSVLFNELERLKVEYRKGVLVFPFRSIRTAFENARRRAGIKDFTFHDLRRTFGTRLLERGVDIVTIKKLYGHSSASVTERYLHPSDKISKRAVELLGQMDGISSQNVEILTHIWPMKKDGSQKSLQNPYFSVN